ncbi:MAG: DNA double-strand break repair nuclease NurA [Chloroflexota bacterium]
MSLEFEKIVPQVQQMGATVADRSVTIAEQTRNAGQLLMAMDDLDAIWAQILLAREKDAGFRGAAPTDEPINQPIPLPDCPELATILASDGSQVYPDAHGAALYWLTNIAIFVYPHGTDGLPECLTEPRLYYEDKDIRDPDGRLIANAAINARRSVYEMQMLARETLQRGNLTHPLLALYDGPLLSMLMGKEVANSNELNDSYHEAFDLLNDLGAALIGYVDRPNSTFVVSTIYLTTLEPDQVTRRNLQTAGSLEGLSDRDLYQWILGPGDRSGMMIQQSPQNKSFTERSIEHEIVFFYMNVAAAHQEPYLARVEIPMWVARQKALVGAIQALLYAQCQITDRYPYSLTRADELAVVPSYEKRALDELIAVELLRNQQPIDMSQKLSTKGMARHGREQHQGV